MQKIFKIYFPYFFVVANKENLDNSFGENIQLIGFNNMDITEINAVKDAVSGFLKKLKNKTNYELLKLTLKQHRRINYFVHEAKAELFIHPHKSIGAKTSDKNIYKAIVDVMNKIIAELEHLEKKNVKKKTR